MTKKAGASRRSDCPLNVCLEIFGDRWSLLIVRDLLFKRRHEFKDYLAAKEGIATNVLSDRLRRLEQCGIITKAAHPSDARKVDYRLSEKGLDLAPVLVEMVIWAIQHEKTDAPATLVERILEDRQGFIADLRAKYKAEQSD
jgi:DNA-binding HxlR family transcriptional regulator